MPNLRGTTATLPPAPTHALTSMHCRSPHTDCSAGREAREQAGAYGEKDAYKPFVLDAAKGVCVAW